MDHITVFSDLTSGKLQAMLAGKSKYSDLLSLVKSFNKKSVYKNVPLKQLAPLVDDIDFKAFGYKAREHFDVITTPCENDGYINIAILPNCTYKLERDFKIAPAPDSRSEFFVSFFSDEYERIKIRALQYLAVNDICEFNSVYAIKNLQFIKTCAFSQRLAFHELLVMHPDYLNHPESYIYYYLNYFLIRLRVFYEKLYEAFLPESRKSLKKLINELFNPKDTDLQQNVNPLLLYNKASWSSYVAEPQSEYSQTTKPVYQQSIDNTITEEQAFRHISKANNVPVDIIKLFVEAYQKLKWNGTVSSLGDVLYQLSTKIKIDDKFLLEGPPVLIASFIAALGLDKNNYPLSKSSIRTSIQPGKEDKRPKEGSKHKIEMQQFFQ